MPSPNLKITVELTTTAQLDALQAALEIYIDMEGDRAREHRKGKDVEFKASDEARLDGAKALYRSITGTSK